LKLQTQVPINKSENQIDYNSQLFLLGSCFVENIGQKLTYFKFQSLQNPFGILFHPLALENLISRALENKEYQEEAIFYLNERWQCFDAHSDLSATSKEELLRNLNKGLRATQSQLEKASHVIITLGTAWVYEALESNRVVANCHKVPQKEFVKKLLPVAVILRSLENIVKHVQAVNKNVQFVFTVSPVRHLKDGFVENQQSKAHVISAIHQLVKQGNASYFPSYEIMMDELRDYRFYAEDMVHPNNLAIEYIWEKFKAVYISEESYSTMKEVDIIQKGLSHRPFNPDSDQHKKFLNNNERKIEYLQKSYPYMKF
tara:strand:+ start:160605 stop:161549 length:945 start_codon:yes stop_codon:yes gene_type:complete